MAVLARQMYPNKTKYFKDKFPRATTPPYGYLLIDFKTRNSRFATIKNGQF